MRFIFTGFYCQQFSDISSFSAVNLVLSHFSLLYVDGALKPLLKYVTFIDSKPKNNKMAMMRNVHIHFLSLLITVRCWTGRILDYLMRKSLDYPEMFGETFILWK